jgi:hypothetical protein
VGANCLNNGLFQECETGFPLSRLHCRQLGLGGCRRLQNGSRTAATGPRSSATMPHPPPGDSNPRPAPLLRVLGCGWPVLRASAESALYGVPVKVAQLLDAVLLCTSILAENGAGPRSRASFTASLRDAAISLTLPRIPPDPAAPRQGPAPASSRAILGSCLRHSRFLYAATCTIPRDAGLGWRCKANRDKRKAARPQTFLPAQTGPAGEGAGATREDRPVAFVSHTP